MTEIRAAFEFADRLRIRFDQRKSFGASADAMKRQAQIIELPRPMTVSLGPRRNRQIFFAARGFDVTAQQLLLNPLLADGDEQIFKQDAVIGGPGGRRPK